MVSHFCRIPLSALAKWEVALKKIFPSANVESSVTSDSIVSGSAPSSMHPPSSQPASLMPQVSSTHTISSRAPQLELQSISSPTLSYSTPTIRWQWLFCIIIYSVNLRMLRKYLVTNLLYQQFTLYLYVYVVCVHVCVCMHVICDLASKKGPGGHIKFNYLFQLCCIITKDIFKKLTWFFTINAQFNKQNFT